jgi:predicted S18 family serine protease
VVDGEALARLERGLRGYIEASVNYSSSLIRYSIQNYALPDFVKSTLEVYLDSVQSILERAAAYRERGDLVASIGFLREALSESLSTIFTLSATEGGDVVIQGYLSEIRNIYSVLLARIASKGYPGGLAPAYADYAGVLLEEDPRAAVSLMEEAIASIILWNILAVTALSGGEPLGPGLAGAPVPQILEDPVLTAVIAVVSYSVGIVVSTLIARASGKR